jgi:hypothetical protein
MKTTTKAGRRGGWQPPIYSSRGRRLAHKRRAGNPATGTSRPAWLGIHGRACLVERDAAGYAAFITTETGERTALGSYADAHAALEAARAAYEAGTNV